MLFICYSAALETSSGFASGSTCGTAKIINAKMSNILYEKKLPFMSRIDFFKPFFPCLLGKDPWHKLENLTFQNMMKHNNIMQYT